MKFTFQLTAFRTVFDTFDEEKVGSVSKESVSEILEILEIPFSSDTLTEFVNEYDENSK